MVAFPKPKFLLLEIEKKMADYLHASNLWPEFGQKLFSNFGPISACPARLTTLFHTTLV